MVWNPRCLASDTPDGPRGSAPAAKNTVNHRKKEHRQVLKKKPPPPIKLPPPLDGVFFLALEGGFEIRGV